jgi:hypothetical protein
LRLLVTRNGFEMVRYADDFIVFPQLVRPEFLVEIEIIAARK